MNCYSKRCINLVTLILAVIIFIQTNLLMIKLLSMNNKKEDTQELNSKISKLEEDISKIATKENFKEDLLQEEWKLIIPKINITAPIKDGVSAEIINSYVGHFEDTPNLDGNIGLIAGSKGYKENYFKDLDKLQENDVIIYKKADKQMQYKVTKNLIIDETDWSHLTNTKDNIITLITGIPEEKNKRRCVQAIEIK